MVDVDAAVLTCLKSMLGVLAQTTSDLVYMESDTCPVFSLGKVQREEVFTKTVQQAQFGVLHRQSTCAREKQQDPYGTVHRCDDEMNRILRQYRKDKNQRANSSLQ